MKRERVLTLRTISIIDGKVNRLALRSSSLGPCRVSPIEPFMDC